MAWVKDLAALFKDSQAKQARKVHTLAALRKAKEGRGAVNIDDLRWLLPQGGRNIHDDAWRVAACQDLGIPLAWGKPAYGMPDIPLWAGLVLAYFDDERGSCLLVLEFFQRNRDAAKALEAARMMGQCATTEEMRELIALLYVPKAR